MTPLRHAENAYLLSGARVLSSESDPNHPSVADVLIRNGKIEAVGRGLEANEAVRVDLAGHLLVPGFVNAHYHSHDFLAKGAFEGLSLERWGVVSGAIAGNRSKAEIRLRTLLGAVECLKNGITTVQDFAVVNPLSGEHLQTLVDAYSAAGIRVILSLAVRDRSQTDSILWLDELATPEQAALAGDKALSGEDQLRLFGDEMARIGDREGMVRWAISPSAPQRCSLGLLRDIDDFRRRHRLPVYTHIYETRLQRIYADKKLGQFGGSALKMLADAGLSGPGVSLAHGIWFRPEEIELLATSGTGVVLNMLSNLKLRSGIAPIEALRGAGVPLSFGCDNCSCSDVQSMLQVMKLYCLLGGLSPGAEGPTASEALEIATTGGAQTALMDQEIGRIEVGMAADIVAYDLSGPSWKPFNSATRQLVFGETGRGIRHVWVAGRQVVKDGHCDDAIEREIAHCLEELMPKVRTDLAVYQEQAKTLANVFAEMDRRAESISLNFSRYLNLQ